MLGSQIPSKAMREAWPISSCPVWTRPVRVVMTFVVLVLVLAATLVFPSPARADGGAPNLAYIAGGGSSGNQLVVIDIGQRRVASKIAIGGRPAGVVLSTDGRYAYVTESAENALAIVDTSARQVVARVSLGTAPTALALDLADTPNLVFISDSGSGMVSVVDPSTRRVRATIPVGMHPAGLAVALPGTGISATGPHDAEVYVANTLSNTVSVISTRLLRVIATIPAPGGPLAVTIPQVGGIAYVSTEAGTVLALGLATHQDVGVILRTGSGPLGAMDYDAVTGQVYVPDPSADVVDVLSPIALDADGGLAAAPAEPVHTLPIGGEPVAVAITFEGSYGFVAERSAGMVTMLDATTRQIQATISVGGAPDAIVTGAYPPSVSSNTSFLVSLVAIAFLVIVMILTIGLNSRRRHPAEPGKRA